jgi:hypothetical protein
MMGIAFALVVGMATEIHLTGEEQAVAAAPWQECLRAQAHRLDDGHSDIAVLGRAVTAACKSEFEKMSALMNKNLESEDQKRMRASLEWIEAGSGAVAIAKNRQAKDIAPSP